MNNQAPEEKWKLQVAQLQEIYPFLHEEDFIYDYGMKDVMLDKLQEKLGKNREELNEMLAAMTDKNATSE